jgi:hypothetical protein
MILTAFDLLLLGSKQVIIHLGLAILLLLVLIKATVTANLFLFGVQGSNLLSNTYFLEAGDARITDLVLSCISIIADLAQILVVIVRVVLHFNLVSKSLQLVDEWLGLGYRDRAHLVHYAAFVVES